MGRNENAVDAREQWEMMELPGRPELRSKGRCGEAVVSSLITDAQGKIVIAHCGMEAAEHAADMLKEYLGCEIQEVYFVTPEGDYASQFAFTTRLEGSRRLSLPERSAVAAIASYYSSYRPGLRKDVPIVLPKILRDFNDQDAMQAQFTAFMSEERAYMLVEALDNLFSVESEVVADAAGWQVLLRGDANEMLTLDEMAGLQNICRLLQHYEVRPARDAVLMDESEPNIAIRHAWREKKGASLQRIEAGVNSILARLAASEGVLESLPVVRA